MTYQEYNQRLSQLEEQFQIEKDALVVEYALANNPYQVGACETIEW